MPRTNDPNRQLVSRVRAASKRLAKSAGDVTDSRSLARFVARLVRWNNARAQMASEIIGEPGWSDAVESSLRKVAKAAMEGAEHARKLERQWEIERLDARIRAERGRPLTDAERQYHAELRLAIGR